MNPIIKSTKSNFIKNIIIKERDREREREREWNQTFKWPKKSKPLDKGTKTKLFSFEIWSTN